MVTYHRTPESLLIYPPNPEECPFYQLNLELTPRELTTDDGRTFNRDKHSIKIFQLNDKSPPTQSSFQYTVNFIQKIETTHQLSAACDEKDNPSDTASLTPQHEEYPDNISLSSAKSVDEPNFIIQTESIYEISLDLDEKGNLKNAPGLILKHKELPDERLPSSEIPDLLLKTALFSGYSVLEKLQKKIQAKIQLLKTTYFAREDDISLLLFDFEMNSDAWNYDMKLDDMAGLLRQLVLLIPDDEFTISYELTQYVQASFKHEFNLLLTAAYSESDTDDEKPRITSRAICPPHHNELNEAIHTLKSRFDTVSQEDTPLFFAEITLILKESMRIFLELKHKKFNDVPFALLQNLRQLYCTIFNIGHFPERLKTCKNTIDSINTLKTAIQNYADNLIRFKLKGYAYKLALALESLKDIDALNNIDKFINECELDLRDYRSIKRDLHSYLQDITTIYNGASTLLAAQDIINQTKVRTHFKPTLTHPLRWCKYINSVAIRYSGLAGIDKCLDDIIDFTTMAEKELHYERFMVKPPSHSMPFVAAPIQAVNPENEDEQVEAVYSA